MKIWMLSGHMEHCCLVGMVMIASNLFLSQSVQLIFDQSHILRCWHYMFSSVTQLCPTLCDPMNCSTPGLPVHHQLLESTQTHVHWVGDAIEPSRPPLPLLLLPSIFPSIRVFSNESALHIRWPEYWSFSFNISPSSEQPGLISFRMDWFDLLAVQWILKSLLQHTYILYLKKRWVIFVFLCWKHRIFHLLISS